MSLLVQLSHIDKAFGGSAIFEDISLSIHQGEIFALIGENGAGKSTLLNLLTRNLQPDKGEFYKTPDLTIGFLPQEIVVTDAISVRSYLEEGIEELEKKMAECLEDPHRLTEWAELHEKYEYLGGYKRIPIEKVLEGLKLKTHLLELPLSNLSSGQRVQVALAKSLIKNPDLLLLDEPTNYLDTEMLAWLEHTLLSRQGATVLVSHDRKFINTTCNRVIEIKNKNLVTFGGNYDFYLSERERLLEEQIKAYERQEEERKDLKQKIKALTFSKGKATAPTDRNLMAYDLRGGKYQKSEQRKGDALKTRLLEIESNLLEHPKPKTITGLRFTPTPLVSQVAIELQDVSKSYGDKLIFSHLSKVLSKGDRVVLTGPNGTGKTTLFKSILGITTIDDGEIRIAPTAKIAYLDQEITFPMDQTPREYFENRFQLTDESFRRELHKAALGTSDLIHRAFSSLSIGQRKRLMLLSLVLEKPNVLLLDEPTNHLDFLTLEAFEKALLNFEGAILAISHDATFIEKIATLEWQF